MFIKSWHDFFFPDFVFSINEWSLTFDWWMISALIFARDFPEATIILSWIIA